MNRLEDFVYNQKDLRNYKLRKWRHYFEIYDFHFSKFVGKCPKVLEIGVQHGGSIEMWNHYFGEGCEIFGVDVDPKCKTLFDDYDNIEILIGNQESREFWKSVKDKIPYFDVVIDDGGHLSSQQIVTFEETYPHISENGIFLVEDLGCNYIPGEKWRGGLKKEDTFIEYSKNLIDSLNSFYWCSNRTLDGDPTNPQVLKSRIDDPSADFFRRTTNSLTFYDQILVVEKRKNENPDGSGVL